jgi:integrase
VIGDVSSAATFIRNRPSDATAYWALETYRELAALRRAFRLALRAGRLVQCPHVPMLQEPNTRRGFLEPEQITAVCAALPEDVRPVVKFAYATGWRTASEVLSLEWRNVDSGRHCVRLDAHTTKNGEARSFPFTADIETILKGQLAERVSLRQHHRHPPLLRSVTAIDTGAASRAESGYPTPARAND